MATAACREERPRETAAEDTATIDRKATNKLYGSYSGPFGDNKITVIISAIKGDSVSGRSIVAGNDRPFAGSFTETDEAIEITAQEPGDDAHDGNFTLHMQKDNYDQLTGRWTAYNTKLGSKQFLLARKAFVYNTHAGTYPQASQRLLTNTDLEDMYSEDLMYMRNEIFARHGYCFSNRQVRQMFETEDWYVPFSTDIKNSLTDIEKKNIALIKKYEKHSELYGDAFGR